MNKDEYKKYFDWLMSWEGKPILLKHLLARKEKDNPRCIHCGLCCQHCEAQTTHYNSDGIKVYLCKIWDEAQRVFRCDIYPICPQALEKDGIIGKCRYYWEDDYKLKSKGE